MSLQMVARRYASALADVVLEKGEAREVQAELAAWEQMFQSSPALQEVFRNPTIALDQKRATCPEGRSRDRHPPPSEEE